MRVHASQPAAQRIAASGYPREQFILNAEARRYAALVKTVGTRDD